MLRVTRSCALAARTRVLLERAFDSSHSGALPGTDNSVLGKVKAEAKKMLRIQLFLIPICVVALVFLFPTPSPEEEKRMREEYERNAGWKTLFFGKLRRLNKPPAFGYEVAELPDERVLRDFLQHHRTKAVLVIVHSGLDAPLQAASQAQSPSSSNAALTAAAASSSSSSSVAHDPLMCAFLSSLNQVNLGSPDEVKLALVPGPRAPQLVSDYHVLTHPTTLLFLDGACVYRCVGARTRELATKSLFMLRNAGRDIFACK